MNHPNKGISLDIDPAALAPIIQRVVNETLAAVEADRASVGDRLAFSEAEAARLIGLHVHQLRDERLRGRIVASQVVGKRIRYLRDDLMAYLMSNRTGK